MYTLKKATDDYINAVENLKRIGDLLKNTPTMTLKQRIDCRNSIERLHRQKSNAESMMLSLERTATAEELREWVIRLTPYMEEQAE